MAMKPKQPPLHRNNRPLIIGVVTLIIILALAALLLFRTGPFAGKAVALGGVQEGQVGFTLPYTADAQDVGEVSKDQEFSVDLLAHIPAANGGLVGEFWVSIDPSALEFVDVQRNGEKHIILIPGRVNPHERTFTFAVLPEANAQDVNIGSYLLQGQVKIATVRLRVKADALLGNTQVNLLQFKLYNEAGVGYEPQRELSQFQIAEAAPFLRCNFDIPAGTLVGVPSEKSSAC